MEITGNNVTQILNDVLWAVKMFGVQEDTRNGRAMVIPEPLIVTTLKPTQRVLLHPQRIGNPFFHLMEGIWMLAGRNDLRWIEQFNSNIAQYSDGGVELHGAYGNRWRHHFNFDQLYALFDVLDNDPGTRRAVLTMWDPAYDLNVESDDIPCNTHIYFDRRGGRLNMTVCNRSNDIIWGMLGANTVHLSMLQEYMAARLRMEVGVMRQFSNNAHVYLDIGPGREMLANLVTEVDDPYGLAGWHTFEPYSMVNHPEKWLEEAESFCNGQLGGHVNSFFNDVASPMYMAWMDRKEGIGGGGEHVRRIRDAAWRAACTRWIEGDR